jgi:hypothetical protein
MTITAKLVGVRALSVTVCLVLLGSATGLFATPASAATTVQSAPPPSGSSSGTFAGAWCPSNNDCWAVGEYQDSSTTATLNEAEHWNGNTWSAVSVPNPASNANGNVNVLSRVRCIRSSDCWAVGATVTSGGGQLNEALHWNGSTWSQVSVPNPAGTATGDLQALDGVACASSSDCWAVGLYGTSVNNVNTFSTLALHWNGSIWSQVSTPNPAGTATGDVNSLIGAECDAVTDCWAVGSHTNSAGANLTLALHWDGSTWSQVSTPSPGGTASNDSSALGRVTFVKSPDCWAVGADGNTTTNPSTTTALNLAEHWNGSTWSQVSIPNPSGTATNSYQQIADLSCAGSNNCWAVGSYNGSNGTPLNMAMNWNGKTWSQVSVPNPGGTGSGASNHLWSMYCPSGSTTHCQSVGNSEISGGSQTNVAILFT